MSGPVDVLAAMDRSADFTDVLAGIEASGHLREARAAVAELIEATASYSAARGVKPAHVVNAKFSRVRAALARVGGAK